MTRPLVSAEARSPGGPTVLVRTLPLRNGNYGGVLQAYALQRYLAKHGVRSVTDTPLLHRSTVRSFAGGARALLTGGTRTRLTPRGRNVINRHLREFAVGNIATVDLTGASAEDGRRIMEGVSTLLVGSDQVWRATYADVRRSLFADLEWFQGTRLSYAASFGRDDVSEYGPSLIKDAGRLFARFDGLSVREASGVRVCRDQWGVVPEQHLDPTLLLSSEDYRGLLPQGAGTGGVYAYLLDPTPDKLDVVDQVSRRLNTGTYSIMPRPFESRRALKDHPERFVLPPVARWLEAVAGADCVVTDSFHGCVFAIVFQRPFVVVPNTVRGATRFSSLLDLFGLTDRMVLDAGRGLPPGTAGDIDWAGVQEVLAAQVARTDAYFARHLAEFSLS